MLGELSGERDAPSGRSRNRRRTSVEYLPSSQHGLDAVPPPLEPHYRARCERLASLLAPAHPGPPVAFDPEFLKRSKRELATYIGPSPGASSIAPSAWPMDPTAAAHVSKVDSRRRATARRLPPPAGGARARTGEGRARQAACRIHVKYQ